MIKIAQKIDEYDDYLNDTFDYCPDCQLSDTLVISTHEKMIDGELHEITEIFCEYCGYQSIWSD